MLAITIVEIERRLYSGPRIAGWYHQVEKCMSIQMMLTNNVSSKQYRGSGNRVVGD